MKAKDIMIPIQAFLKLDNTLKEAVNILWVTPCDIKSQGTEGLPVQDQANKIIGILSMQDILKAVHPFYMSMTEADLGNFTWDGMVESLAKEAGKKRVEDYMTRELATIRENDPLMKCVDLMIKRKMKQLLVLDDHGKVVGMIYERDVFSAITKAMMDEGKGEQ